MPDPVARRVFSRRTALIGGALAIAAGGAAALSGDHPLFHRDDRPLALVYRGPASLPGTAEAVAALLERRTPALRVEYCGPDENTPLTAETLSGAVLYAQPGGGSLADAWPHLRRHADDLRNFVATGGTYLGFCLGGYLAGRSPGFGLFDGDTLQYITTDDATIDTTADTVVAVDWRGEPRHMFFQDGTVFRFDRPAGTVLARYTNGEIAAFTAPYGQGRVGLVGPHPEADASWYGASLHNPDGIRFDLGDDLVDSALR